MSPVAETKFPNIGLTQQLLKLKSYHLSRSLVLTLLSIYVLSSTKVALSLNGSLLFLNHVCSVSY